MSEVSHRSFEVSKETFCPIADQMETPLLLAFAVLFRAIVGTSGADFF